MMSNWQGWLYVAAVLIPLAAFTVELLFIRQLKRLNAYIATAAIATSFVLSMIGLISAVPSLLAAHHAPSAGKVEGEGKVDAEGDVVKTAEHGASEHHGGPHAPPFAWTGGFDWVALGGGIAQPSDSLTGAASPPTKPLVIPIQIRIDGLSAIMFAMVTFIATLVHLYSMGYMSDDPRYPRFFTYLSLFCFSMLALLASANIFMVFMSWELVGVCSYLLIGFWYEEKKNGDAANKAFIANRVGDVGMLVGLGLIWAYFGTFNIADINGGTIQEHGHAVSYGMSDPGLRDSIGRMTPASAGEVVSVKMPVVNGSETTLVTRKIPYWILVVAGLGIFAGCVGKSAQFPLHVWLPDAMAGPTPVSALIHAATMVAAGVYLVGRFFPLFTDGVLLYIAYTGGLTLLIAATIALVQTDYKKVLAYSTVSQLGFMMLGLGVGGWAAGLFHLITHAFFKALLFLGAGSVYHSVHTYEMPKLGGLLKKMPITAWTMLIATLAISGVPFFSGFYSKDAILANSLFFIRQRPEHLALFILPAVGAMLTAFYMFRMWFLLFAGEPRKAESHGHKAHGHGHDHDHGHDDHGSPVDHAHESGPLMAWPLLALAVPAVIAGYPWFVFPLSGEPVLEQLLAAVQPVGAVELGNSHMLAFGASLLIATAGIGGAAAFYYPGKIKRFEAANAAKRFGPVYNLFVHKWYFDEIYDALLIKPTLALGRGIAWFDKTFVDGIVNASAGLTLAVSKFEGFFDAYVVDGVVGLTSRLVYLLGDWGRMLQTGRLRNYLAILALAVVGLFAGVFYWIRPTP